MSPSPYLSPILLLASLANIASGQWNATIVGSDPNSDFLWMTADPSGIGGCFRVSDNGEFHAGVRSLIDETWIDLHPSGPYVWSEVRALDGRDAAGMVRGADGHWYAALWSGSSESFVDLHVAGMTDSGVFGASGGQQCGYVKDTGWRAALWRGSPETYVDLQPLNAQQSYAAANWLDQQVGYVRFENQPEHAALWRGTPESWVDLNPGPFSSMALGVRDGQQVGYVRSFEDGFAHASLWAGSSESWVDLHSPFWPWGSQSAAVATSGEYQCGSAEGVREGGMRATLWWSTAQSAVDLHCYLPGSETFFSSEAIAVWTDARSIYVFGIAQQYQTGERCAILWSVPICRSDYNRDGFINGDDYDGFALDFESGDRTADLNWDCFVNGDDYDLFAAGFELGC